MLRALLRTPFLEFYETKKYFIVIIKHYLLHHFPPNFVHLFLNLPHFTLIFSSSVSSACFTSRDIISFLCNVIYSFSLCQLIRNIYFRTDEYL